MNMWEDKYIHMIACKFVCTKMIVILFQNCMTSFLLLISKEDIFKNVCNFGHH